MTPEEINFLEALLSVSPAADIESLVAPGSAAADAVAVARDFVRAFDFHRPDLPGSDDDHAGAVAGGASPCAI
jgi:hypothetical protein